MLLLVKFVVDNDAYDDDTCKNSNAFASYNKTVSIFMA